jgi:hypothetical protein
VTDPDDGIVRTDTLPEIVFVAACLILFWPWTLYTIIADEPTRRGVVRAIRRRTWGRGQQDRQQDSI